MSVSHAKGDLFDPKFKFDAIGHGVNCLGQMGSGIAVEFKRRYYKMYTKYTQMCQDGFLLPGMVMPYEAEHGPRFVYNIASQYRTGRDARLDALQMGLLYVSFHMRNARLNHLGLPHIGAGIGGLDLNEVLDTIHDVFEGQYNLHVTVVEWAK